MAVVPRVVKMPLESIIYLSINMLNNILILTVVFREDGVTDVRSAILFPK